MPDDQADLGILFALNFELKEFVRALRRRGCHIECWEGVFKSRLGETMVLALSSGVGWERARASARFLVDKGVEAVLAAGIAGGLDPKLARGDLIIAKRVYSDVSAQCSPIECDLLLSDMTNMAGHGAEHAVRLADIISCKSVICLPEEKARLYVATGAAAVDMESYAVAQVCRATGIRFSAVRVVSDTASDILPGIFADGGLSKSAFLWGLGKRPTELPSLLGFYFIAQRSARKLATFLVDVLIKVSQEGRDRL
ncbi:MAG: hypothetical protein QHI38_01050 [Armatimonadota bacterium]|nr:hypothetical protein [Armatimonadota bacterium]